MLFQPLNAGVLNFPSLIVNELHLVTQVQNSAAQWLSRTSSKLYVTSAVCQLEKVHNSNLNDTPPKCMFDQRAGAALDSPTSLSPQFVWELVND